MSDTVTLKNVHDQCPWCGGYGEVETAPYDEDGNAMGIKVCPACHGRERITLAELVEFYGSDEPEVRDCPEVQQCLLEMLEHQ